VDNIFNLKIQFIKSQTSIIELIRPNKSNIRLNNMFRNKNYAYRISNKIMSIDDNYQIKKI